MNTLLLFFVCMVVLVIQRTQSEVLHCSGGWVQQCNLDANHKIHCICVPTTPTWTPWGEWTSCTVTCGEGNHTRYRSCIGPRNGKCVGPTEDTQTCAGMTLCPGTWGNWGAYKECSQTCGGGLQIRSRNCSAENGSFCVGDSISVSTCNTQICPGPGVWGKWSAYTDCSKTCGGGLRTRSRNCSAESGSFCIGDSLQSATCNTQKCPGPVDGVWSAWGSFGACSVTCGTGIRFRTRSCSNPAPTNGGSDCSGHSEDAVICTEQLCPVDGGWSEWSGYSHCSVTCGNGFKIRRRTCTNPQPSGGGADCVGVNEQGLLCTKQACPVDGGWSVWSDYKQCSVSCGGGHRLRHRSCDNPPPSYGGQDCPGNSTESEMCNISPCPDWSTWGTYSACSKSCGAGFRYRFRTCPVQNKTLCIGLNYQYASCDLGACSEPFG
ncbi:coadhesin-like [Ostrea edulis]|uniref:coadhesin-like n=1 Tax=Ostrea edulis TaxID=37623 RepID=UPI0024AF79C9|nr:coadhesin-like [Ostrea edulis]